MPACGWTPDNSVCSDWSSYTPQQQAAANEWATEILWALTGRQFGARPITVRPCGPRCRDRGGWWAWPVLADVWGGFGVLQPFIRDGQWFNCGCAGRCSCRASEELWLPGPVASVDKVQVGADVLDPSAYRVDNGELLVRVDGGRWPDCQDLDNGRGDADTLFVDYKRGTPVPQAGNLAAGMLACEFAKAISGAACGLPENLQSLSRNGVQVTMIDPTSVLTSGLTGNSLVDLWIRSVNPRKKSSRSLVWSPELDPPRMVTG